MKISFHGAARNVTGSQHLLEVNGKLLLLDCGMFQGKREVANQINRTFGFDPRELDAVILSHAHIDHCGNLPNLVKKGYQGPIYTTHVSAHLVELLLQDSAHIQESDAEYINSHLRGNAVRIEPLYTAQDAEEAIRNLERVKYNIPFEPIPGVQAQLVDAGHILGSSSVVLDIRENGRKLRFWYSGDVGRCNLPIVRDPVMPKEVDYLLMESTYGDKPHEDPEIAYDNLRKVVSATVARGGKVIIPAFAVGRTQDLIYALNKMIEANELPRIPVFVDSPLAVNVTDIFRNHQEFFDDETWKFMRDEKTTALGFDSLTYTRSVEESKALNSRHDPMVIISASGMAETGRILHHLKNNIEDPKNLVLLVSYQAPNTLGRRLAEGETQIKIFGEIYERRCDVVQLDGFSAHADQDFLVEYAMASRDTLKQVFLVHGEQKPAETLQGILKAKGIEKVLYPYPRQTVEL
jgi:metallo-beta-lactamase family protein